MEYLFNGYTLEIAPGAFPLSTDSMVLAHFIRLPRQASVLDLGSGCASLGLMLCARFDHCRVTGVELDEAAHQAAQENIRRNQISHRLSSICADMRNLPPEFAGQFDCCISNPPYFSGGQASRRTPIARHTACCRSDELMETAAKSLKYGGDFYLVHKPERLAELIVLGSRHNLEAKRLLLVRHRDGSSINLICLQFRKGGKPGITIEENSLYDCEDNPTAFYKSVYHITED